MRSSGDAEGGEIPSVGEIGVILEKDFGEEWETGLEFADIGPRCCSSQPRWVHAVVSTGLAELTGPLRCSWNIAGAREGHL